MAFRNVLQSAKRNALVGSSAWEEAVENMLILMAPAAPHISEELWARAGREYSVHRQSWPVFDSDLAAEDEISVGVQINGKVRDRFTAPADIEQEAAIALAKELEGVKRYTEGKTIVKAIYVPGRLVNLVVKG